MHPGHVTQDGTSSAMVFLVRREERGKCSGQLALKRP